MNATESILMQIIAGFHNRGQESEVAKAFQTLFTNGSIKEASRILTNIINKNTLDPSNLIPCIEVAVLLRQHINNDLFYNVYTTHIETAIKKGQYSLEAKAISLSCAALLANDDPRGSLCLNYVREHLGKTWLPDYLIAFRNEAK